jgi:hypothetical protein
MACNESYLQARPAAHRREPNEIGVIVKDGVVTLTGWVDSYTKKWAAREAALQVDRVKAAADEIEVRLPSAAQRTDADVVRRLTGGRGVDNLPTVRPQPRLSLAQLKQEIENALVRRGRHDSCSYA